MSTKVKRGLGLLVVAVLALVAGGMISRLSPSNGPAEVVQAVLLVGLALALLAGFFGGLALIAWGLLRD